MSILRMKAEKIGRLRFLSHLESQKMVERSLRRAGVPLKFSQGFNPHPNISFAAPLPVGTTSQYELIDVEVLESFDLEKLLAKERDCFPEGFKILAAVVLEKPVPLMKQVAMSDYLIWPGDEVDAETAKVQIKTFMERDAYMVERRTKKGKRKQVDIRSQVREFIWNENEQAVFLKVDTGSQSNLKPLVIIREIFGWAEEKVLIKRTKLYKIVEGEYIEFYEEDNI